MFWSTPAFPPAKPEPEVRVPVPTSDKEKPPEFVRAITPPVGINLYVVQGLRKRGRIDDVIIGAAPFVITMLVMLAILSCWPQLALWLPSVAAG